MVTYFAGLCQMWYHEVVVITMEPKTRAKTKAHCTRCLFEIRKGELVSVSVAPVGYHHLNCKAAVEDGTGRQIHPDFKHFLKGFNTSALNEN